MVYRVEKDVTTAADGSATEYVNVAQGKLHTVVYVADGSAPYDNTVDMTITSERTGEALLSQSNVSAGFTKAPRQATHDTAGVASVYATGGEPIEDHIALANDRIKIVLAQGGNVKTGKFHFTFV
jgi:hypothetical protein